MLRESLLRLAPSLGFETAEAVGGWWNRQNNPEVDVVAADREVNASKILFAGSIKWHDSKPFDRHDHAVLVRDTAVVPGTDQATELIAVSRNGTDDQVPIRSLTPADIIGAWDR